MNNRYTHLQVQKILYVYIYNCIHVHTYIYIYAHTCWDIQMHTYVLLYVYMYTCIFVYLHMYVCVYVYTCAYARNCLCVCIHIHPSRRVNLEACDPDFGAWGDRFIQLGSWRLAAIDSTHFSVSHKAHAVQTRHFRLWLAYVHVVLEHAHTFTSVYMFVLVAYLRISAYTRSLDRMIIAPCICSRFQVPCRAKALVVP